MGATNVRLAYTLYAGRVPATSMVLLAYMANVALDADSEPWYSEGHEVLARRALGRGRDGEITIADLRAIERAITPLRRAGAITTTRAAAPRGHGPRTVKYRLHLDLNAPRKTVGVDSIEPVDNPPSDHPPGTERPTKTVRDAPRKVVRRPTKSGETPHENRGTEEYEEYEEREEEPHHLPEEPQDAREATTERNDTHFQLGPPPAGPVTTHNEAYNVLRRFHDLGDHLLAAEREVDPDSTTTEHMIRAANRYLARKEAS